MPVFKSTLTLTALASAFALLPIAPPAVAQSPDAPTVSVEFGGGTADQYIAVLRDALPGVNIVERGPVARVPVNPISIRGADPFAAVLVLDEIESMHSGEEFRVSVDQINTRADRAPIFVVTAMSHGTNRDPASVSRVMSLQEILTLDVEVDHALSAVETALALDPKEQEPSIRYHEDTALLIVRAHPQQVQTIEQVLDQLMHGARVSRSMRDRQQRTRQTQERVEELEAILHGQRSQIDAIVTERTEWQARAEMYLKQNEELRNALAESRSNANALRTQLQQMRRELSHRNTQGDGGR